MSQSRLTSLLHAVGVAVPSIRRLRESRNALLVERDRLSAELDNARATHDNWARELIAVGAHRDILAASFADAQERLGDSAREIADMGGVFAAELAAACAQRDVLLAELASTRTDRDTLAIQLATMRRDTVAVEFAAVQAALGQRDERLAALEAHTTALDYAARSDRNRIDYALAGYEGILAGVDAFHAARATSDYRAAFTKPNPLVSICVPTANRPDLLINRCLRSLLDQSYENLQIVVVGDHCDSDTERRVAALRDDRIVFRNLPQRGPYPRPGVERWQVAGSHPDNAALALCEGHFITHLDDDDRADPDRIATLVSAAQAQNVDFCWHPFWWENPDGSWRILGDGTFRLSEIGTSCIFYHRYFVRYEYDVFAYRLGEPGDWNRLRKIKLLRPSTCFIETPLVHHYRGSEDEVFVPQPGETFLD